MIRRGSSRRYRRLQDRADSTDASESSCCIDLCAFSLTLWFYVEIFRSSCSRRLFSKWQPSSNFWGKRNLQFLEGTKDCLAKCRKNNLSRRLYFLKSGSGNNGSVEPALSEIHSKIELHLLRQTSDEPITAVICFEADETIEAVKRT